MTWNSIVLLAAAVRTRWQAATLSECVLFVTMEALGLIAFGSAIYVAAGGAGFLLVLMWALWAVALNFAGLLVALTSLDRATQAQLTRTYLEQAGGRHTLRRDGRVVAQYAGRHGWQLSA
jgi:hypothetical protein